MSDITPMKNLDAADLIGIITPNGYKLDINGAKQIVDTHNSMNDQYLKDTSFSGFNRRQLANARVVGNIYNILK